MPANLATSERFSTLHWTPVGMVIGLLVKPLPPLGGVLGGVLDGVVAGASTKKTVTSRA